MKRLLVLAFAACIGCASAPLGRAFHDLSGFMTRDLQHAVQYRVSDGHEELVLQALAARDQEGKAQWTQLDSVRVSRRKSDLFCSSVAAPGVLGEYVGFYREVGDHKHPMVQVWLIDIPAKKLRPVVLDGATCTQDECLD